MGSVFFVALAFYVGEYFVCIRPVSCVLNVASFSGFCPFMIAPAVLTNVYLIKH